ncbi:hypothetical protein [Longimicrobium sp.]|uniref:hypothetical protein n=1 Tax=Longimicrobium sp. TaxID=2029185 RepID=UPI003B3AF83A
MKLARLFLAVFTISTLAACGDSVTAPEAAPAAAPSEDAIQCDTERLADGSVICRGAVIGSGG